MTARDRGRHHSLPRAASDADATHPIAQTENEREHVLGNDLAVALAYGAEEGAVNTAPSIPHLWQFGRRLIHARGIHAASAMGEHGQFLRWRRKALAVSTARACLQVRQLLRGAAVDTAARIAKVRQLLTRSAGMGVHASARQVWYLLALCLAARRAPPASDP
jgi:hypothetical protein